MKQRIKKIKRIVYTCLVSITGVYAQPGSLDASFYPGTGANNNVFDIALQQDQKIIVAGSYTTFDGFANPYLNRLNHDGSLDFSFVVGSGLDGWVKKLYVQSDDKIIVAGNFQHYNGTTRNGLLRLNANGTLDFSFNPGLGSIGLINALAVQSDGKLIVGGSFTSFNGSTQNRIVRLTANGTVDATFVTGNGFNGEVTALEIQSDGKIVVGGQFSSYNTTPSVYRTVRLNIDGSLDGSFWSPSFNQGYPNDIALQPDGKILIAGFDNGSTPLIRRLNSDGYVDATFLPPYLGGCCASSIVYQNDGKVVVGGEFGYMPTSVVYYNLVRFNPDGSFDQTFIVGTGPNEDVMTIELQADNRILIGGYFTQYDGVSKKRIARLMHCSSSSSIAQIEACSSYSWIDGITYTSSTNTPSFLLSNSAGCDSIVTLHLTINQPSTVTLNETACDSFTLNNQNYTQSGTYAQQLSNAVGCDSTIILNLTIPVINTSVTQNQSTLTSVASTGTYQWMDCGTMTLVAGETSQTFTATQDGSYAVIVSNDGCSDTSECFPVAILGVQHNRELADFRIYPNPSNGNLKVAFSKPINGQIEIVVKDQIGRIVNAQTINTPSKELTLNLESLQIGIYTFCIKTSLGDITKRLIIE